jgi:hypothetical protein
VSLAKSVSTLSEASQEVSLPEACTKGLEVYQVRDMQEAVYNIRTGTGIYIASCANNLYELRNSLKGNKKGNPRQWTQFKKAELVPFKPREITDLVTAWEGWFSSTTLSPESFNLVGIRTAAKIAGATSKVKAIVEADLLKGLRVTEKMVDDYINPPVEQEEIEDDNWEDIKEKYEEKLSKMDSKKLKAEAVKQREKVYSLEAALASWKGKAAGLEKLQKMTSGKKAKVTA